MSTKTNIPPCTLACEAAPDCLVCKQRKHPIGRDAPAASSYCGHDCPGYTQEPRPGHLWPGELARIAEYEAEQSPDDHDDPGLPPESEAEQVGDPGFAFGGPR